MLIFYPAIKFYDWTPLEDCRISFFLSRHFISVILQFQWHEALCKTSGHKGDLHRCNIYGSKAVGKALRYITVCVFIYTEIHNLYIWILLIFLYKYFILLTIILFFHFKCILTGIKIFYTNIYIKKINQNRKCCWNMDRLLSHLWVI